MTKEEIHNFAVQIVAGELQESGYEIHAFNPVLGSYPSVIAENNEEVIAIIVSGAVAPKIPKLKLTDKFGIIGLCDGYPTKPCFASVGIGSADVERFDKSLALIGDKYLIRYTGLEYIDKKLPEINSEEYKLFVMQFIGGYLRANNYEAVKEYIANECIIDNSISKEKIEGDAIEYFKNIFERIPITSHCVIKSIGNVKTLNVQKLHVEGYSDGKPGIVKILQEADKIGLLIVTESPVFDYDDNGIIFNVDFDKKGKINKIELIDPRLYEFEAYKPKEDE